MGISVAALRKGLEKKERERHAFELKVQEGHMFSNRSWKAAAGQRGFREFQRMRKPKVSRKADCWCLDQVWKNIKTNKRQN